MTRAHTETNSGGSPTHLRSALAAVVVAALVATAGCTAITGGGGGGGGVAASPATGTVPANVDMIAYVDVQGAVGDDALRELTNTYLQLEANQSEFYAGPTSVEEAIGQMQNSTSLDVNGLVSATMFLRYPEANATAGASAPVAPGGAYGAVVLQTKWNEDEFVGAIENQSASRLEKQTYSGQTLYTMPGDGSGEGQSALGVLGDGYFVVGDLQAVKDAIDAEQGNAESVSGRLLNTFKDTRDGYVRFASVVPREQVPTDRLDDTEAIANANIFREVELVAGSQYVTTETKTGADFVGAEFTMVVGDESTAKNLRGVTIGAISWARETLNGTDYHTLVDTQSLTVERSGTAVTVTSENAVVELKTIMQKAYGSSTSRTAG